MPETVLKALSALSSFNTQLLKLKIKNLLYIRKLRHRELKYLLKVVLPAHFRAEFEPSFWFQRLNPLSVILCVIGWISKHLS